MWPNRLQIRAGYHWQVAAIHGGSTTLWKWLRSGPEGLSSRFVPSSRLSLISGRLIAWSWSKGADGILHFSRSETGRLPLTLNKESMWTRESVVT